MTPTKIALLSATFMASALPAAAQDLCAGVGSGGQWIGGNESASDVATADTFKEQLALVLGGNQYVSLFNLSAPAAVRIEAQGRGSGDPFIDIIDADGNIVSSDDDSGGEGASRAELDLDAGAYCVTMASYDGVPMTAFMRIGLQDHEALTPGVGDAAPASAGGGGAGNCAEGIDLGVLGDGLTYETSVDAAPFLRFTLDQDMPITITADNEDADPTVTLYDADENYLDENDDFNGLNSRLDMGNGLPAGDYCIGLGALNDTSQPIVVAVSEYDPVAAQNSLYDRGEASPPLDGSYPVTNLGEISTRLRQDATVSSTATWYSVDVVDGGVLVIEAVSIDEGGDPWIAVYDDFGREVGVNDDHGDSYDSFLAARVTAGTYMIAVKQVSSDTVGTVRLGLQRYVPAK